MTMQRLLSALFLAGTLTITACGTTSDRATTTSSARSGYGTVESVQVVDRNEPGLLGTIAGGVVGGVIGHQIGSGRGQTATTIVGAAGGAYAGREIEKRTNKSSDIYKITVRMDDGSYQAIAQETNPNLRVGDHVRIHNGVITRQ